MRYPLLLDELILRDFAMYLGMILVSFILLTLVFTFFELLGDIVRNRIPMIMVGQYLLNVTPSMIYIDDSAQRAAGRSHHHRPAAEDATRSPR